MKTCYLIVLDSLGIGGAADAADFADEGSNTYEAIYPFLNTPCLRSLGFDNIDGLDFAVPVKNPLASFARLAERSRGKDTTTGHYEIAGLVVRSPHPVYPQGFPDNIVKKLCEAWGVSGVLGNKAASGTEIIKELGQEHLRTGLPIVYTSADSVLQICGNEETFGLDELYRCCEIAREITMKDEWRVGRVIARPYVGKKKGGFKRTSNRHDYALKPFGKTALNALQDAGLDVISVGKIRDIFDGEGITGAYKSKSSVHGMEQTIELAQKDFHGLCFVNLVDFDALWGHRRNPQGYAEEIEKFDVNLGNLLPLLKDDDLLIITADHGNDPTYTGTDHTREKVPFLAYSPSMSGNGELPETDTFAVIGATVADNFGVKMPEGTIGESLMEKLR